MEFCTPSTLYLPVSFFICILNLYLYTRCAGVVSLLYTHSFAFGVFFFFWNGNMAKVEERQRKG